MDSSVSPSTGTMVAYCATTSPRECSRSRECDGAKQWVVGGCAKNAKQEEVLAVKVDDSNDSTSKSASLTVVVEVLLE